VVTAQVSHALCRLACYKTLPLTETSAFTCSAFATLALFYREWRTICLHCTLTAPIAHGWAEHL